jgi:hypothetical protein
MPAHAIINSIKKHSFFTLQPCLLGMVFVTHRRTHMRACSLHKHAYMHACTPHRCALVHTYLPHRRAVKHACSPYRHAQVRAYRTHRCALVRACSTHRRALQACLKFSLPCTHAHIFGVQAHTYARLSPNRPCMWGPHPIKTP